MAFPRLSASDSDQALTEPFSSIPSLSGDVGLSEAESRSVLDERALVCGRLIFGGHFPLLIALLRDARALYGKWP
jgi:hypothetical protein